ncbi:uncharacterized protein ColSpa_10206 [Colletotrichum spaethianum]|uniref:Uncharacterized protein n=1 Tax=Colletotrichum spaethianum TaxID=700344 RepID=A0AA37UP60_9PEZI|nr:uncharacterized protein ColSpa_10206 [Colletotrichum spaethianum]GKT50025.1 hypothetical protein ColSpa_10206 [Colletotrichum spaethianum]
MVCITRITALLALSLGAAAAAVTPDEAARVLESPTGNVNLQLHVTRDAILAAMARNEPLVGTVSKDGDSFNAYEKATAEDKLLLTVNVKDAKVTPANNIKAREPVEWFLFK